MSTATRKKQSKREGDYLRQTGRATMTPRQRRRYNHKFGRALAVAR